MTQVFNLADNKLEIAIKTLNYFIQRFEQAMENEDEEK